MSDTATLSKALDQRRARAVELRELHQRLIVNNALQPDDAAIQTQLHACESELARAQASIPALEQALEAAQDADRVAQAEAVRKATESKRLESLAEAKARVDAAGKVDRAGAAWVESVVAFNALSQPLVQDVLEVVTARAPSASNAADRALLLRPVLAGSSGEFAAALAEVVKSALAAVGGDAVGRYVAVNTHSDTAGATYKGAATAALTTIEAALK